MNVFNETTVVFLELNGCKDTAVTELWNCLNAKTKDDGISENDKKREPFKSIEDVRFDKILSIAENFKEMDVSKSRYSCSVTCLTLDTNNALFVSLHGLVSLIKLLLQKHFGYIMADNFRSDRLEGENK